MMAVDSCIRTLYYWFLPHKMKAWMEGDELWYTGDWERDKHQIPKNLGYYNTPDQMLRRYVVEQR
jgi:hypothetical protein